MTRGRRSTRVGAGLAWAAFAATAAWFLRRRGVPARRWPEQLRAWIGGFGAFGPAVYVLLFAVRPLTLLPATVMTVASGLIWGPIGGTAFTLIGENLSAAVAFWAARLVGGGRAAAAEEGLLRRLERRLSGDAFRSVLVLRLCFAPFDAVNFACGLTAMSYRSFAAATAAGIAPGVVCFVLLGCSWRDPRLLASSAAALAAGLAAARLSGPRREPSRA